MSTRSPSHVRPSREDALHSGVAELQERGRFEHEEELNSRMTAGQEASQWQRTRVLIGAGLSQLPIWGFAMSYGVLQEYFTSNWTFEGSQSATGIIGTTSNGVMYLSMPLLFALFTRKWVRYRRRAALCGTLLAFVSFLSSSYSTTAGQLIATQGVFAALGCALVYSPTTLSLSEWYSSGHRAIALGVTLSCKNIVGSTCPFLFRQCLDTYGFRTTMQIWAGILLGSGILSIYLTPTQPAVLAGATDTPRAGRKIPWHFLRHRTFYIYSFAIVLQSCGYGIPQTYLNSYAHDVAALSQASATLLLTLFNLPGIVSSTLFGYLSEGKRFSLSATTVSAISACSSAFAAWLLWGLASEGSLALLVLFSVTFGFFAGGYSATWGGVINEMATEAAQANEAIDTGMVYGLLNGFRGIGYVVGGLVGLPLLEAGKNLSLGSLGYGTTYGPLILFTGMSSILGGWGVLWKCDISRKISTHRNRQD